MDIKEYLSLIIGSGSTIGERLVSDKRVPLISATGQLVWVRGLVVSLENG